MTRQGTPRTFTAREIETYEGLVRSIAWQAHRTAPASVEIDDLVAFGFLGLMEAAERFDPARGVQFTTYAYPRIRGAIYNGMAKMTAYGRGERPGADRAGGDDEIHPVPAFRSVEPSNPVSELSAAESRARLTMLVGQMPDQMRELIRLVYVAGLTIKDAGDQMNLSKSWACRVHARAIEQLVTLMRREGGAGRD
jgi:RNA polymerase sigma factor for flagellar operon FliA